MSERRPTPPLVALRAFDAAARLGSFREAAEELGVTPGAVSRHIKALEMRLGLRLFDRFNRSVVLTADGRRLAQGVADAFERLEAALDAVRPGRSRQLRISALPSLAGKWLSPRLHRFSEENPDLDLIVFAEDRLADLSWPDGAPIDERAPDSGLRAFLPDRAQAESTRRSAGRRADP